jgi:hypothetical protein
VFLVCCGFGGLGSPTFLSVFKLFPSSCVFFGLPIFFQISLCFPSYTAGSASQTDLPSFSAKFPFFFYLNDIVPTWDLPFAKVHC